MFQPQLRPGFLLPTTCLVELIKENYHCIRPEKLLIKLTVRGYCSAEKPVISPNVVTTYNSKINLIYLSLTHSLEVRVKLMHSYSSSLGADSATFGAVFPHLLIQFLL